jgi:DEAD/DEAH box helicase domain-containing protein
MSVAQALETLRSHPRLAGNVVAWSQKPPRAAELCPFPSALDRRLQQGLRARGIEALYSHQAQALDALRTGGDVVLVTGTASGKTLAYNLPILQAWLEDPQARALYLFPTKALAQDQAQELKRWSTALQATAAAEALGIRLYDGDTPAAQRARIRQEAQLLLSNPDMLHTGILPHHTRWSEFLAHLRFVVVDEIHGYSGVFGSHMANVVRRLRRVCAFYGARPQFLCTSATIANPRELAEGLLGSEVTVIDHDGSPSRGSTLAVYNPPLVDAALGLRRSYLVESLAIAEVLLRAGLQIVLFARTRRTVEILLGYLREQVQAAGLPPQAARGYRAGYLSEERREIEQGLRSGEVRAVVATNALELGVDIGSLGAAVLVGYPGRIASLWQQAGRAGRREEPGLAVLVASPSPLDQFLADHPRYLLETSPEHARINADNLSILANHLRCAAFELPFQPGEIFGRQEVSPLLEALAGEGEIHPSAAGEWQWIGGSYPASEVSLRAAGDERVAIQDVSAGRPRLIGEVDRSAAPLWVHEGAIYLHEAQQFLVETLDWAQGVASVRPTQVDYYTEASESIEVQIREVTESDEQTRLGRAWGRLRVTAEPVSFRKVRRHTQETLGHGEIHLPAREFDTVGSWLWIPAAFGRELEAEVGAEAEGLRMRLGEIDYGPSWEDARLAARRRDGFRCQRCGAAEVAGREHDVHHRVSFRAFGYQAGINRNDRQANALENLLTLCRLCHTRLESQLGTRTALGGLAYALHGLAPLFLMCDARDLGLGLDLRHRDTGAPTITFYDQVPEGIGLAEELYALFPRVMRAAAERIATCSCAQGCPSCIGPVAPSSGPLKELTLRLAERMASELERGAGTPSGGVSR